MKKILLALIILMGLAGQACAEDFWVYIKAENEITSSDMIAGRSQKGDIVDVIPCARSAKSPSTPGYFIQKVSGITEAQRTAMLAPYTETKTELLETERTITTAEWSEMQSKEDYSPFIVKPTDISADWITKGNTLVDRVVVKGTISKEVTTTLAYRHNKIDVDAFKAARSISGKTSVATTAVLSSAIIPTQKTTTDIAVMQREAKLYDRLMPVRQLAKWGWDKILPNAYAASLARYVNTASSGGNGTTNETSGTNAAYASLNIAEDSEDGDLTDNGGDALTINCSGTAADTTAVTVSGWTTSPTCTLTIQGNNTTGKWDSDYYILAGGEPLYIYTDNITFKSMQLRNDSGGAIYIPDWMSGNIILDSCILYSTGNFAFGATPYFINCIFQAGGIEFRTSGYMYSCTCWGGSITMNKTVGTLVIKNVISYTPYEDFYAYSGSMVLTNCISFDGTADDWSGSNNIVNQTVSFVSTTAPYDLHLLSTDTVAIGAGVNTSSESAPLNFTTDIDGTTRSGTWDIGADEYVSSSGGVNKVFSRRGIAVGMMNGVYR